MTLAAPPTRRRPGYTLVELLVVMALIVVLAALTVLVTQSGAFGSQQVVSAADRASGWLLIAKQRALRDGQPRGVRFAMTADPNNPTTYFRVREAQYIEQPDPWIPNADQELNPTGPRIAFVYQVDPANQSVIKTRQVFFVSNNPADVVEFNNRGVTGGHMLLLPEFGTSFLIASVAPVTTPFTAQGVSFTAATAVEIKLASPPDLSAAFSPAAGGGPAAGTMVTYKFAIQAPPQPLLGEPALQLTGNIVIDLRLVNLAATPPSPVTTTFGVSPVFPAGQQPYFDVLFSPSGQILNNATGSGIICLWVRDPDKVAHPRFDAATGIPAGVDRRAEFDAAGEQVLVTIYTQTGLIATHPPVPPPVPSIPGFDPYQYAKDGANSGL